MWGGARQCSLLSSPLASIGPSVTWVHRCAAGLIECALICSDEAFAALSCGSLSDFSGGIGLRCCCFINHLSFGWGGVESGLWLRFWLSNVSCDLISEAGGEECPGFPMASAQGLPRVV